MIFRKKSIGIFIQIHSIFLNFTFITCLFRFVLKISLNIFTNTTDAVTKYYLLNVIHEIIYFYSSLRNTCVFDTSSLSAFDMKGYFDVFIELIVKVTGVVFEDTLKVICAFSLKCRPGKFPGKQIKNKLSVLPATYFA